MLDNRAAGPPVVLRPAGPVVGGVEAPVVAVGELVAFDALGQLLLDFGLPVAVASFVEFVAGDRGHIELRRVVVVEKDLDNMRVVPQLVVDHLLDKEDLHIAEVAMLLRLPCANLIKGKYLFSNYQHLTRRSMIDVYCVCVCGVVSFSLSLSLFDDGIKSSFSFCPFLIRRLREKRGKKGTSHFFGRFWV